MFGKFPWHPLREWDEPPVASERGAQATRPGNILCWSLHVRLLAARIFPFAKETSMAPGIFATHRGVQSFPLAGSTIRVEETGPSKFVSIRLVSVVNATVQAIKGMCS